STSSVSVSSELLAGPTVEMILVLTYVSRSPCVRQRITRPPSGETTKNPLKRTRRTVCHRSCFDAKCEEAQNCICLDREECQPDSSRLPAGLPLRAAPFGLEFSDFLHDLSRD